MKAAVQRVIDAMVTVNGALKGGIHHGLLVYLGVAREDTARDADWLVEKIAHLRIFDDPDGKMNLSLMDIINQNNKTTELHGGREDSDIKNSVLLRGFIKTLPLGVLAVSQFTLLGDARKGRRPSWEKAAPPEKARELYLYFIEKMREKVPCESGEFQARMKVTSTNDGPVTILLDSALSGSGEH